MIAILSLLLGVLAEPPRPKTDLVTLQNGNQLLGEAKGLEKGVLRFKTDSAGTLQIEWDEVLALTSEYHFQVELTDGTRYFGPLLEAQEERMLVVDGEVERRFVPMARIVRIASIEEDFWERVDGSAKGGYSETKGSNVTQVNLGLELSYFGRYRRYSLSGSAIFSIDEEDEDTRKVDITSRYYRLYPRRYFLVALAGLEQNTELGLDLRAWTGAGPGRFFLQTQDHELSAFGGLSVSYEVPEDESTTSNLDFLVGSTYEIFIDDTPETHLTVEMLTFPGLTDFGRVRSNLDVTFQKEIVEDFFWDVSLYIDYDSEPPGDDGSSTDYGLVTGLGYSF